MKTCEQCGNSPEVYQALCGECNPEIDNSILQEQIKSLKNQIDFQRQWMVSMASQITKLSHAAEIEWEDEK